MRRCAGGAAGESAARSERLHGGKPAGGTCRVAELFLTVCLPAGVPRNRKLPDRGDGGWPMQNELAACPAQVSAGGRRRRGAR
jgi:hypothetical protein